VIFTRHALQQAALRGISRDDIIETLTQPDSTIPGSVGDTIAQKAYGSQLLRVVYQVEQNGDILVITAYKTS
jgi:dihydropteroate synthase